MPKPPLSSMDAITKGMAWFWFSVASGFVSYKIYRGVVYGEQKDYEALRWKKPVKETRRDDAEG